jgi:hypothetical protein
MSMVDDLTARWILWRLRVPMEPYGGIPLPPGDRCPVVGCGARCRYGLIEVTPDVGSRIHVRLPDGRIVERQVETAKGRIDGRCTTRLQALEPPSGIGPLASILPRSRST